MIKYLFIEKKMFNKHSFRDQNAYNLNIIYLGDKKSAKKILILKKTLICNKIPATSNSRKFCHITRFPYSMQPSYYFNKCFIFF